MIEKKYFDNLKMLEIGLCTYIRKHEKAGAPKVIIDEIQEALNHITKAIEILDWDDL